MPTHRWTYSDYITFDGAERLTRLRLHIQEVSDFVQGVSERGTSATAVDTNYLQTLLKKEEELAVKVNSGNSNGGFATLNPVFNRDF